MNIRTFYTIFYRHRFEKASSIRKIHLFYMMILLMLNQGNNKDVFLTVMKISGIKKKCINLNSPKIRLKFS